LGYERQILALPPRVVFPGEGHLLALTTHQRGATAGSAGGGFWKLASIGHDVYDGVYGGDLMRTNIVLDDDLLAEAIRVTGLKTKKDVVHEGLRLLVATKKRKSLLDLKGKIELAPGYDYKSLRTNKR
jgi:Arc/MetJ family transcription regulator